MFLLVCILTISMATKQAMVVFQSPLAVAEALPTRTLQKMKSPNPSFTPPKKERLQTLKKKFVTLCYDFTS